MNTRQITQVDFTYPLREQLIEFVGANFDRLESEMWTLVPYDPFYNFHDGRIDLYELKDTVGETTPIILRLKYLKVFLKMIVKIEDESTIRARIFYLLEELSNNLDDDDLVIITDRGEHEEVGTHMYAPG